jgi:hypothetical protein
MPRNIEDGGSGKSETIIMGYPISRVPTNSVTYWVVEAIKTGMAPNGNELRPCQWHSGYDGDTKDAMKNLKDPMKCYIKPVPRYGIWLSGYECLDTCAIDWEKDRQKNLAESRANNLLIETLEEWASESVSMHMNFVEKVHKSQKLRSERDRLQRELARLVQGPDLKSSQYQALLQLKMRAETHLLWVRGQAELHWKPETDVTLEHYIRSRTNDAVLQLEKATEKLKNWVNRGVVQKTKIEEVSDHLKMLQSEVAAIDTNVRNTIKLPFYFTRRALSQLHKLRWFINNWMCYKQNGTHKNRLESQIHGYLEDLTDGLNLYTQWIPLSEQDAVYNQVQKEQEEAAAEEINRRHQAIRQLNNQQTAVLGELIIGLDGTAIPVETNLDSSSEIDDLDLPTMSEGHRLKMMQIEASQAKQVITLQGKISMSTDETQMKIMSLAGELEQYDQDERDEEDWRAGSNRYYNRYDDYVDRSRTGKPRGQRRY